MENALFSFEPVSYGGAQGIYEYQHQCYGKEIGLKKRKQTHVYGEEELGGFNHLGSKYGLHQETIPQKEVLLSKYQPQYTSSDFEMLDDFQLNMVSPPVQSLLHSADFDYVLSEFSDLILPQKEMVNVPTTMASLEILTNYPGGKKWMNGEKINVEQTCTKVEACKRLSTEEVMRVAGARYIEFSSQKYDQYPFAGALSGLAEEETKDVELAHLLFASAEKVGNQQFDRASRLLIQCDYLSSRTGNPVQRVVYYFAEALRGRINSETGSRTSKWFEEEEKQLSDIEEMMLTPNPAIIACYQTLPFSQIMMFGGVQSIVENVASAKKVHLIDLGIKTGMAWIILMQALSTRQGCPVELFRVTAVGTSSRKQLEETGKRCTSFAESMNISFSFNVVIVPDMKDLREDMFELGEGEVVAIYAPFILRTMVSEPGSLESLMRVIRNLKPCVMVLMEIEANHNSPAFVSRFIEALFYFSAFFDCLEACMDRDSQDRMVTERNYFGCAIQNIVANEGEKRKIRHVGIEVWRAFFARFGMVELELSHSSMYQSNLVLKQFACGSSCTLDMIRKSLIVGWKGTPIHSLSSWKFQ
ncbi:hypothetical protein GIB67_002143 [Kingdonia uniflora]|uniref:DELLA protein RGL1 n=1 Tax=Kingdonia uniflora TaxID=39325 RepID=A0A7J7KWQ1_9MAGN|nr:hypothetical protein GIB67_002143 [Kingdonia uniflora]